MPSTRITARGPRQCEYREVRLTDPTWTTSVETLILIVRPPGDVAYWEAWGQLFAGVLMESRRIFVSAATFREEVDPTSNDAIALAVCRWCLSEHRDFFLALLVRQPTVPARPTAWDRILSSELL